MGQLYCAQTQLYSNILGGEIQRTVDFDSVISVIHCYGLGSGFAPKNTRIRQTFTPYFKLFPSRQLSSFILSREPQGLQVAEKRTLDSCL